MAKAFAPAYITGFFVVNKNSNVLRTGSQGCGIVLSDGLTTEVKLNDKNNNITIKINGIESNAPTTLSVLQQMTNKPINVDTKSDVPIGAGFGSSGAGALSTAFALNELLHLNKTSNQLLQIAHTAEVYNLTGLGSVIAQLYGGVVIRKKAGVPPFGILEKIPVGDIEISYVTLKKISTKSILSDPYTVDLINSNGKLALKNLLKKPTMDNFMKLSKKFAIDTELISSIAKDAVEAVESDGGMASMAMLGDTVFAIGKSDSLSEFGIVKKSKIGHAGARLLV